MQWMDRKAGIAVVQANQLRRGHTIVVDVFDNWFPVASVAFLGRHEFSNHVDIHLNNGRVLRKVRGGRSVCVRQ